MTWQNHVSKPRHSLMLRSTFVALALTVILGAGYSVVYNTYLDTSNPILAHLPHPLAATHYFANKRNVLNVYFIKKAWGWTTAAFFLNWTTSPHRIRTGRRLVQYLLATLIWLLFTAWFFGPSLFERLTVASGGQCILNVPSGDQVIVPYTLCYSKSTVSPASHPDLFPFAPQSLDQAWNGTPRLRRGHDVSGHIFLLTLSILLLVDQLAPSFYIRRQQGQGQGQWSALHYTAIVANITLIAVWFFGVYTTSVFFHSPLEKFTGLRMCHFCKYNRLRLTYTI